MKYLLILIAFLTISCANEQEGIEKYQDAKTELLEIREQYGDTSAVYLEQIKEVNEIYKEAYPAKYEAKQMKNDTFGTVLSYICGLAVVIFFIVVYRIPTNDGLSFIGRIFYFINPSNVFSGRAKIKSDWIVRTGAFIAFLLAYLQCINLFIKVFAHPSIHSILLFIVVTLGVMTASMMLTKVAR